MRGQALDETIADIMIGPESSDMLVPQCNMMKIRSSRWSCCLANLASHDSIWQLKTAYASLWQLRTTYDSLWQLLTANNSMWQCDTCESLWQRLTTFYSLWTAFDSFFQLLAAYNILQHLPTLFDSLQHLLAAYNIFWQLLPATLSEQLTRTSQCMLSWYKEGMKENLDTL